MLLAGGIHAVEQPVGGVDANRAVRSDHYGPRHVRSDDIFPEDLGLPFSFVQGVETSLRAEVDAALRIDRGGVLDRPGHVGKRRFGRKGP